MNINQYAVYQLKESAELAAYRSRSYQYLTEHHFQVIVQNYQQAYFTKLFTSDTPEIIRKRLEEHRPKNFRGRPFGVGDVIVINQQGEITAYFVDKDSLVVVAGFIRSSSSGMVSCRSEYKRNCPQVGIFRSGKAERTAESQIT